jgi:hypothetical protein
MLDNHWMVGKTKTAIDPSRSFAVFQLSCFTQPIKSAADAALPTVIIDNRQYQWRAAPEIQNETMPAASGSELSGWYQR